MERNIITQCLRAGRELPNKIKNAPELTLGLDFYFIAFEDLTNERVSGLSTGAIMLQSIVTYCNLLCLDNEQIAAMIYHIKALDNTYLTYLANKNGNS